MQALLAALIAAQGEMSDPVFDGYNPHFRSRYASLGQVLRHVRPALHRHGLTIVQRLEGRPDIQDRLLITELWHVGGACLSSQMPILAARNDPQAFGSGLAYARRYAIMAMMCLASRDEDDDGERASPHQAIFAAIAGAADQAELAAIGERLRRTNLDANERAVIKQAYTRRWTALGQKQTADTNETEEQRS